RRLGKELTSLQVILNLHRGTASSPAGSRGHGTGARGVISRAAGRRARFGLILPAHRCRNEAVLFGGGGRRGSPLVPDHRTFPLSFEEDQRAELADVSLGRPARWQRRLP